MWQQPGQTNKGRVSDQTSGKQDNTDRWTTNKESTDCSLYDSGRTDSGFLSGANIHTETGLTSGEITPPNQSQDDNQKECDLKKDSYMRLDSGVDVGLSDQLSELCIQEQSSDSPDKTNQTIEINLPQKEPEESAPWNLYFHQDDEGDTQLHIAIIQGFIEVVFSLMRMVPSSVYLDIRNDMSQTALHLAVLTSQPRILRRLVCAGANTRVVDRHGNTALHLATAAGDIQCVKALTEPVTLPEVTSIRLRYTPLPRQSHPPELDMFNYEGLTCIHMALMARHIGILKHLVCFGANIDARECKCGRTVLHMAAEFGDENLACILLKEMQADPEVPNYAGHTPYHIARRNPSFIRALVASGAPDESDYYSSEDEDDDESDIKMFDGGFRSFHINGGIVNATA